MQTVWVRLTKAKSYDRGVRSHSINEWVLMVILFLSVIVGKKIVEELELRVAKGVIKMWQGPALVDGLFSGVSGVDWNHSESQGKRDALGISSNMIHVGVDIGT
jgi:hypothetical protein